MFRLALLLTILSLFIILITTYTSIDKSSLGDKGELEKLFAEAVKEKGEKYIKARDAIIGRGEKALSFLEEKAKVKDWETSITAESCISWIKNKELCEKFFDPWGILDQKARNKVVEDVRGDYFRFIECVYESYTKLGKSAVPVMVETILKTQNELTPPKKDRKEFPDRISIRITQLYTSTIREKYVDYCNFLRTQASVTLANIDDPKGLIALIKVIENPEETDTNRKAVAHMLKEKMFIHSVEKIDKKYVLEVLEKISKENSDNEVRKAAQDAFKKVKDEDDSNFAGMVINAKPLPDGKKGKTYDSQKLRCAYGEAPIKWEITEGKLPSGLNLSSDGEISGKPEETGTFNFTVKVTDATSPNPLTATKKLSIKVIE